MNTLFIYLLVGVVVGFVATMFFKKNGDKSGEQKILDFIHKNGTVTSEDVQNMLEVPDTVADQHLREMEDKKHIIEQEEKGKYVNYEARRR